MLNPQHKSFGSAQASITSGHQIEFTMVIVDLLRRQDVMFKLRVFFSFQPINLAKDNHDPHLQLPAPHKQFLISPPASPPVDWEQSLESRPVINYDLIHAIAELAPGKSHLNYCHIINVTVT